MRYFFRNLMIFLAILTATLIPIMFFLSPMEGILGLKSKVLLANKLYMNSMYIHIVLGGIALLIGWVGFIEKIRLKYRRFHRITGRIYVICFLITAISSVGVSFNASGGWVSKSGFIMVGLIAIYTTFKGFVAIINGQIALHRIWMQFSYACCLASVTLRLWNIMFGLLSIDFYTSYSIVAWLSWVPNLLFVKFYLNKN